MVWRRKDTGGGSILGWKVGVRNWGGSEKTAGCRDGSRGAETAAAREHGRSDKLWGHWWEGWMPESEVARTKWVGSGGAAEAGDGTPATRASV